MSDTRPAEIVDRAVRFVSERVNTAVTIRVASDRQGIVRLRVTSIEGVDVVYLLRDLDSSAKVRV